MSAPFLIDLSHTSHTRARTGIQRVARALHTALGSALLYSATEVHLLDDAGVADVVLESALSTILDLEDSVPPADKVAARETVRKSLDYLYTKGIGGFVRVNSMDKGCEGDIEGIMSKGLTAVCLPKLDSVEDIRALNDYIGQDRVRDNLHVSIEAAKGRSEALDHVLLYGPPGLGKTTLAYVIGNEMGVPVRATAGPVIEKPGDLVAMLTNLQRHEVLFIDEIHRLPSHVEEVLYSAMEDGRLDVMIGQGPSARSISFDLKPFTLVGATTRAGMLTNPLRDRFGIVARLEFYTPEELLRIVMPPCAFGMT